MWLHSSSPKELAPKLFELARYKRRTVYTKLQNLNWIRNISRISSPDQLEEFTLLFMALESIHLNQEKDSITWNWTATGKFSDASAYDAQFRGSFSPLPVMPIWQAYMQPRCKFFAWLVIHDRILTASNMIKKNWPCNHNCSLCLCMHKTTDHLLVDCNYTEAVWNYVSAAVQLPSYSFMSAARGPNQWVEMLNRLGSKKEKKKRVGMLCIF
jgi:hypothetical protein